MMTNTHKLATLFTVIVAFLFSGCHRRMAPTITAGSYNDKRNETDYVVLPYGSVSLPGKWTHGRYSKESRQQYFSNADSTVLSVAFGPCDKLGFPTNGAQGYDFVKLYYKWEGKYQEEILHRQMKLITADSVNKYMLWQLHGDGADQFLLTGARDCNCGECAFQNFTLNSRKLSDEQKIKFLQDIYLQKK